MTQRSEENQNLIVSLIGILTIDIVLLLALFAEVDPHPPGFLGPFIGAMSMAIQFSPTMAFEKSPDIFKSYCQ